MVERIAVIGAGVVGLCLSEQLAVSGAQVDLIERDAPGAGATSRSFAWINATFDKQPRSYFELSRAAVDCWRRWGESDPRLGVRWVGSVEWADELGSPKLERALERHRGLGASARAVSPDELAELEPEVSSDDAAFACATADEAVVEPAALVARLVERCEAAGVRLHRQAALSAAAWASEWRLCLKRADEPKELFADAVVLAAGTATDALARLFASEVSLVDSPGVLVEVPAAKEPRGVVLSPEVHFRSTGAGFVRAGLDFGGEDRGWSDERIAAEIGRRLGDRIPGVAAEEVRFVRGERPMPADGLPVVGRLQSPGELFVAVMHSGVTLAPFVAEGLAAEILTGDRDERLADFRPRSGV
ncbi:MAG: FAD-dependent oxidoreductase [Acidobacteriota bacterium]